MEPITLLSLPSDIIRELFPYLDFEKRLEFSCTCKYVNALERDTDYRKFENVRVTRLPPDKRNIAQARTLTEAQILIEYPDAKTPTKPQRRFIIDVAAEDIEEYRKYFRNARIEVLELKAKFCPATEHIILSLFQSCVMNMIVLYFFPDLEYCSNELFANITKRKGRMDIVLTWIKSTEEVIANVRRLAALVPTATCLHLVKSTKSQNRGTSIYSKEFLKSLIPKGICVVLEDPHISSDHCIEIIELFINSTGKSTFMVRLSERTSTALMILFATEQEDNYDVVPIDEIVHVKVPNKPHIKITMESQEGKTLVVMKNSKVDDYD